MEGFIAGRPRRDPPRRLFGASLRDGARRNASVLARTVRPAERLSRGYAPQERLAGLRGRTVRLDRSDRHMQKPKLRGLHLDRNDIPDHHIHVRPVDGGWRLECDVIGHPQMFLSGAKAERGARALAQRIAKAGRDVRISIYDRQLGLIGTQRFFASPDGMAVLDRDPPGASAGQDASVGHCQRKIMEASFAPPLPRFSGSSHLSSINHEGSGSDRAPKIKSSSPNKM